MVVKASEMLQLSSLDDAVGRIATASSISVEAYTLHGPVLDALEAAARRGACVVVELERSPYGDRNHHLAVENARIARELHAAGARAKLADRVHAKTMVVDGMLYLDEKNWHRGDIVLRENDRAEANAIAMTKRDALAREATLLSAATARDDTIVESESFGFGNATYASLKKVGLAGSRPRLLVSDRDLRGNRRERAALEHLQRDGVQVRVCKDSAKLAVCANDAWLGSANATYAGGRFAMPDWGLCTKNAAIVNAVRTRLESEWSTAKAFKGRTAVGSCGPLSPGDRRAACRGSHST